MRTTSGASKPKSVPLKAYVVSCADCDELMEADNLMSWEREVPVKLRMAESGPMSEKPICVMTALRTVVEKHPHHPALGLYIGFLYYYLCFSM